MDQRLLTLREAAARLNVSVATLKRYIYEGKVRSAKLPGGHHRIPEEEIARVLAVGSAEREAPVGVGAAAEEAQPLEVLERWLTELDAEVERLAAAVEALAAFCGRADRDRTDADLLLASPRSHHEVLVLGTGCKRCEQLYQMVRESLQQMGRTDVGLRHVKDVDEIAGFGPVLTPALAIDGEVVLSGRLPTEATLRELLADRLG
ncbi:MAG: MTH895/ArsE family thioredoxin-like protein [Armatimonadetes bacterium]|nr:MTH895/ArsE family thioredoxin-like protein [Armatimonadota bacterium]